MECSKVILPKKGVGFFYIIGTFLLFFFILITVDTIKSYPYPVIILKPFAPSIFMFVISLGWLTYRRSGEISRKKLTIRWHIFFIILFKKEVLITTYDTIFVDKMTMTGGSSNGATATTTFYTITLADSSVYNLDTLIVTPSTYKKIFSINEHFNFNTRSKDSLERCVKVTENISNTTGLKIIYSEIVKEELINLKS